MLKLPPLSLYIHIPWCIKKCPYCDFNSYTIKGIIPQKEYITHILMDLQNDLKMIDDRQINTIFIGGGTPNLLKTNTIKYLIDGIRQKLTLKSDIEITMEVNPGNLEIASFIQYQQAGINRISIGIQSFATDKLLKLGRIHSKKESIQAASMAAKLNLHSFNLDIMHSLPDQTPEQALCDLNQAISLSPQHISWYQLTIEPNTLFSTLPPILPNEDKQWQIFHKGHKLLNNSGYQQYEISSYAKPGYKCHHNLNYWRFGDYLGIGCGAHGKISFTDGRILRTIKTKYHYGYMNGNYLYKQTWIKESDRPFEFFMNRFRLLEPVAKQEFIDYTGLEENIIRYSLDNALEQGYITETKTHWQVTKKGQLFLNSLLILFL